MCHIHLLLFTDFVTYILLLVTSFYPDNVQTTRSQSNPISNGFRNIGLWIPNYIWAWPFRVMLRHRSRDHFIPRCHFL